MNMRENSTIISRLFRSFDELDTAIQSARVTLEKKEAVPVAIVERLRSYDTILAKQKNLAQKLCVHVEKGEWDEVARHVTLINGLSAMIRDDARAILSSLALNSDHDENEEINFC